MTKRAETTTQKTAKKTAKKTATKAQTPALAATLAKLGALAKKPLVPAKPAQLAKIEKLLGSIPDDLRALYALGANLDVFGEPDGLCLLSPATAVSSARDLHEVGAPAHVLPIATDHGGNFACFDASRARIVDWDHETREVTALAPTLAALLEKRFVKPLARDAADEAAIVAERAAPAKARPAPLAATPKKVAAVPAALIAKLDRPGYGGGTRSMVFVGDDRLALGFQNSIALVKLGGAGQDDLWTGGDALAFEPRTGRLVAASWGQIAIFDVAEKRLLARFKTDIGHGAVAAISPDGALLAVGDTGGSVRLFDLEKGSGIPALEGDERTASYQLPKGEPVAKLEGAAIVHALAFRPDGAVLAAGSDDGAVRLWDVKKHACTNTIACKSAVRGLDFARDGQALFAALASGRVEVFGPDGEALRSFGTRPAAMSVRVLDNGFVAAVAQKQIGIHDPATGKLVAKAATKPGGSPRIGDVKGSRIAAVRPAMVLEVT